MAGISIEIRGQEIIQRLLGQLNMHLADTAKIHDRIGTQILAWIHRNFRAGGLEKTWTPLRASTVLGRRKKSSVPLRDSGSLEQSFSYKANASEVVIGSVDSRAEWHHRGVHPFGPISPKVKRALSFPFPVGRPLHPTVVRGLVGAERRGEGTFTTFRGRGRSRKDLSSLPFLTVKRIKKHPGIPARPILPSNILAQDISVKVVASYVQEVLKP